MSGRLSKFKCSLIVVIVAFLVPLSAQQTQFSAWSQEEMDRANTAKNTLLTTQEKLIFLYFNLIRIDGKRFADTYVKDFFDRRDVNSRDYEALVSDISKSKNLVLLLPHEGLQIANDNYCTALSKEEEGTPFANINTLVPEGAGFEVHANFYYTDAVALVMDALLDAKWREACTNCSMTHFAVRIMEHPKSGSVCTQEFASIPSVVENIHYPEWSESELAQANTAPNDTLALTTEERKIFFYINLARLDGEKFFNTYVTDYCKIKKVTDSPYYASLKEWLSNVQSLTMLYPSVELNGAALYHTLDIGKSGATTHASTDGIDASVRIQRFLTGTKHNGENIAFGDVKAIDIVINLLLAENVPSLGHRINILDKGFKYLGTSIRQHKEYRYCCVQDFSD